MNGLKTETKQSEDMKKVVGTNAPIRRTVLLTKEMDDNQEAFINLKDSDFKEVCEQKSALVYKVLKKAMTPIYSGAIDHRMNLLDT
jgi:hypothetical protein